MSHGFICNVVAEMLTSEGIRREGYISFFASHLQGAESQAKIIPIIAGSQFETLLFN